MSDKTDFSIDIPVDPHAGLKPLPDLAAFDLCKPYPMPGGNLLLRNTRNGKRAAVRPEVYNALVSCNVFQSIDAHANRLMDKHAALAGQRDDVRGVLQQMLQAGILCSTREVIERLGSPPETDPEPGAEDKAVAAVITWERPDALQRLLASVVENCAAGNLHCLYVIDDSRSAGNIEQNRRVVEQFANRFEAPLIYFGRDEQRALIKALVGKIPQHEEAVRFLIDPDLWADQWTSGLARNLATLLSVGRRLVVMDDDVVCDVYDPPGLRPGITFSDGPRENDFFAGDDGWAHLHQPINPDPIDRHLQFLGSTLSGAIAKLGSQHLKPQGFEGLSSLLASELQADSPVLITECGSLGCPGTASNTWLPDMTEKSLRQMLASQRKTTYALNNRKVWSGRANPHFSPRPNMSQITGLDNRQMLPPYLPILRGEDRLFGIMLDYAFPASVALDQPWATPHLPIPERNWQLKDLNFTPRPTFPSFFLDMIIADKSGCHAADASERLASLAAFFRDLASAPSDALAGMQLDVMLDGGMQTLKRLDELLAADSAPVDWQNYLRNGIKQLNTGLDAISRGDLPLRGAQEGIEGEALIDFWRKAWNGFASACEGWPVIRRAAAAVMADDTGSR